MTQLWVGNTEVWQNEEQLIQYIKERCNIIVRSVWFCRNKQSGQLEGYGFLDFENSTDANQVMLQLKDTPIPHASGARFRLNLAASRPDSDTKTLQQANGFQAYVGNLPAVVTDDRLLMFFKRHFPQTLSARLICDPSGRSKGFGFVRFNTFQEVKDAIRKLNGSTEFGRPMKVSEATANRMYTQKAATDTSTTTLFIKDIDPEIVIENTLRHHFQPYGNVLKVKIVEGHADWAYVTMETRLEAESARNALQGSRFGGSTRCSIEFGKPVDDEPASKVTEVMIPMIKPKKHDKKKQAQFFNDAGVDRVFSIIRRVAEIDRADCGQHTETNRDLAKDTLEFSSKMMDWQCAERPASQAFWYF